MKSGEIQTLYFNAFFLLVLQQPTASAKALIFPALSAAHGFNGSQFLVLNILCLLKGAGCDLRLLRWLFYGPC